MTRLMLILLLAITARAELPDAPSATLAAAPVVTTQRKVERFWDRQQRVTFAITLGIRATDAALTCAMLARGGREAWMPSQTCAGVTAWIAGGQAGTTLVQWLLWRAGKRRMARWLPVVAVSGNAIGIGFTLGHWGYRPKVGDALPVSVPDWEPSACRNVWDGGRWVTRCY